MAEREIPWVIEDQTKVKHVLLTKYIKAWMSILLRNQEHYGFPQALVYFDGFSGPGEYYSDETKTSTCKGSPLLVAEVANQFIEANASRKVYIYCIDKEKACVEHLSSHIDTANKHKQEWVVCHAEFDAKINEILDSLEKKGLSKQPMFFFIDPFGYSGYPLTTLKRIMTYPLAELFINYMVYDIVRFCEQDAFKDQMKSLFGDEEYLKAKGITQSEDKQIFLKNLYCKCLENTGAEFVMPFRVNTPDQGTRPRYYLIHASKNMKALKVMKDNMAKTSDLPYHFEAINRYTPQMDLFDDPEKIKLKDSVLGYIKSVAKGIAYDEVENWAYKNTSGVSNTIKKTLVELENAGEIVIVRKERQKTNTVTSGAVISC